MCRYPRAFDCKHEPVRRDEPGAMAKPAVTSFDAEAAERRVDAGDELHLTIDAQSRAAKICVGLRVPAVPSTQLRFESRHS